MFPPAGSEIYYNEAGEPTGWDIPGDDLDYCDFCGCSHGGECPTDYEEDVSEDAKYDRDNRWDEQGVSGYEL